MAAGWLPNYICTLCKLIPPHQCRALNISNICISNVTHLYVSWPLDCSWLELLHMHTSELYYFPLQPSSLQLCVGVCMCVSVCLPCVRYTEFLRVQFFFYLKPLIGTFSKSIFHINYFIFWFIVQCLSYPLKILISEEQGLFCVVHY